MEFSADDYAVLVAHPAPFRKFPEPFLCLIRMSRSYTLDEDTYPTFIHDDRTVADPTKVKIGEREHAEEESRLLDSTIGRVVPLLPGDFAAGGGQEAETEIVMGVRIFADENVVTENPKRPRKKRQVVTDASGSSHHPKKLKWDHETSSGAATGGKSPSVLKELLASSMLNVEVGVAVVATLPMITSSVSVTLEHKSGVPAYSITRLNIRTIGASERFVISSDSSHHSSTNAFGVEADSVIRYVVIPPVMTDAVVHLSWLQHSHCSEIVKANTSSPSYSAKQDLSMGSWELNSETLHQTGYCLSERKRLESEYEKQAGLVKAKDDKVKNLKAQLQLKEAEAAEVVRLRAQVSAAEATEKMCTAEIDTMKQRNVALKNEKNSLDGKVAKLQSSIAAKGLEVKDLNVVVSSLRSQKDGLVDQVHALETTCSSLRDQEYLLALGAAISRAIEKGMQDGLSAGIDHGRAGRSLADVVAYNPSTEADYNFALQRLREVDFSLLAELKSHKNASVDDIMNLLRLEGPLADAPGMSDLQPHVDQLMLPVHRSEDQVVLGETSFVSTTIATTTALSTTFASASSVPPITIEDYKIVGTDGPKDALGNGQGNVASFPTVEFEKEELDTTPGRDLAS
ncbi:hypothetical protein Tco_0577966 [Tanacetum coccineum]